MGLPFFNSSYLNRTIYLSEIDDMPGRDVASLRAELKVAVSSMQEKMHEERDVAESDWLYGISLKIKICEQFLERIDDLANLGSFAALYGSKLNHYYLSHLWVEISNELGPHKAQELFNKSRVSAVAQLRKESAS
jgi:hypothetical protein